jgi:hypothetical protein
MAYGVENIIGAGEEKIFEMKAKAAALAAGVA